MTFVLARCTRCDRGCPQCELGAILIPEYPMTDPRQVAAPANASCEDDETVKRMANAIALFVCQPNNKKVRAEAWKQLGLSRRDADRLDKRALELYKKRPQGNS